MLNDGFEVTISDPGELRSGGPGRGEAAEAVRMSHVTAKHGTQGSNYDYHRRCLAMSTIGSSKCHPLPHDKTASKSKSPFKITNVDTIHESCYVRTTGLFPYLSSAARLSILTHYLGWAGLGTHLGHPGRSTTTAVGQFEHSDTVHWLL